MLFGLGDHVLELHYVLSDTSLSDGNRRCAVDVDAFTIVARTAMADNVTEMAQTSDIARALRGKSAYDLWLETHEGTEEITSRGFENPLLRRRDTQQNKVTMLWQKVTMLRHKATTPRIKATTPRIKATTWRGCRY